MGNQISLTIKNLWVSVEDKPILKGVSLDLPVGQVGILMGPNGSGKSTLGFTLAGHPRYEVNKGAIFLGDLNIISLSPSQRSKEGLFLGFQNPLAIPGVSITNVLRTVYEKEEFCKFYQRLKDIALELKIEEDFLRRPLNDGFSGGEKKKMELLQVLMLKPKFIIFDEIDTGLDVDALRMVLEYMNKLRKESGVLLITHHPKVLNMVKTDKVWVLKDGKVAQEGGAELGAKIEKEGYGSIEKNN